MKYFACMARRIGVALALSVFSFSSQTVLAQDGADDAVEEVVVTGSRIRQNPLDARTPVQILTAEDMKASGDVSIGDFLQRLPIAGSSINRSNNASGNLGFPPDGAGVGAGADISIIEVARGDQTFRFRFRLNG